MSPQGSRFVVDCPLQLAVSEHPQVAIVEPERVAVVAMPSGELVAELGLQPDAEGVDVGWLGPSPRLLVVSRLPDHTQLHLIDATAPSGVRSCAEKRVEVAMRLAAVSGSYALLCGAVSSAVVTRTDDNVSIHPVAARGVPAAAGAIGGQLAVALPGMIELWDPVARVAKRRLKLPRPAQIRAIGGSERQLWLTTLTDPNRLEVLVLINRGQPKVHELPEPIASVAGHHRLDLVACTGADTGRVYLVDLDGRAPIRTLEPTVFGGPPMATALLSGRHAALVAVAAGQPPRLVALDGSPLAEWPVAPAPRAPEPPPPAPPILAGMPGGPPRPAAPAVPVAPAEAAARPNAAPSAGGASGSPGGAAPATLVGAATVLRPARAGTRDDVRGPVEPALESPPRSTEAPPPALLDQLARWRARADVAVDAAAPAILGWRDELARWAERFAELGAAAARPDLAPPLVLLFERLALPVEAAAVVQLLYGAHLHGRRALAPAVAVQALRGPERWREALAGGPLGAAGVLRLRRSRLELASAVLRVLDEREPKHGELVGSGVAAPPDSACAYLWDPSREATPREVAEAVAARLGCPVLAVSAPPLDFGELRQVCLEAKVRGAVATLPYPWLSPLTPGPLVYVAPSRYEAEGTGLPIVEG